MRARYLMGVGVRMSRNPWFVTCVALLLVIGSAGVLRAAEGDGRDNESAVVRTANWELAARWTPDSIARRLFSLRVEPHWLEGSDRFWYQFQTQEGTRYWLVDPARATKRPLFDPQDLSEALTRFTGAAHDPADLRLADLEILGDGETIRFTIGENGYEYKPGSSRRNIIENVVDSDVPEWCSVSPDGSRCAFVRGNDLYLLRLDDPQIGERRLTRDGVRGYGWGDPWQLIGDGDEPRAVGVVWSPDSRHTAVLRADQRKVAEYWIVEHLSKPRPSLNTVKLPMPEERVPEWQVWVVDVDTNKTVQVDSARWPDQTLEEFSINSLWWSDDSDTLFFHRRSRDYTKVDLCAADRRTGKSRVVVEERLDGMVYMRPLVQLPDGRLLWWSTIDGWGHYSLYERDGTLANRLTSGSFNVEDIVAVDAEDQTVFLSANGKEDERNPYYEHLYRVSLDGSGLQLLTPEDADHSCVLSPSRSYVVDNFSRVDLPTRSVLRDASGTLVMELETADVSGLSDEGWQPPEVFSAMSADGVTEQWGVMYKPFDFDPDRKYPIVTRVYPGKMDEYIPKRFGPVNAETALAQLGCIVVQFGNRGGTRVRGLAYREHGRDDFRDYGLADKKAVIEELAGKFEFIDRDRVGIYGRSSGGFMTVSAMLVYPEFFKVGVALAAPNDPSIYSNEWAERYAGVEQIVDEHGAVSWKCEVRGNLEIAKNLKGRLLMVYGGQDEIVPLSHLIRMVDAFVNANKRVDTFVVPGTGHGLSPWRYTYGMVWTYFAEHLIGDRREGVEVFPSVD